MIVGFRVEVELSGPGNGWTDISADVVGNERVGYGIRASGPADRVAGPGELVFTVNNSKTNSAGLLGYYAPGNAACRPGWQAGIGLRWSIVTDGTPKVRWRGWLDDIDVQPGLYGPRTVACIGIDWIGLAARTPLPLLATAVDVRADEALDLLIAAVPVAPDDVDAEVGTDVYPFVFDQRADTVYEEVNNITLSEFGQAYVAAGKLYLESRAFRLSATPALEVVNPDDFRLSRGRAAVRNSIKVTSNPREAPATAVTLFTLQTKPQLAAGQSMTIECVYVDPAAKASRVAGRDFVTPAATTHYTANEAEDGTGADRTANLDVDVEFGADRAAVTLTNTHGSASLHVTLVRLEGKILRTYEPVVSEASDAASITTYGPQPLSVDLPYQVSPTVAAAVAAAIVGGWSQPVGASGVLKFTADPRYDAELFAAARDFDISTCLTVVEEVMGVAENYWINGVELEVTDDGILECTWFLTRADTTPYWRIGAGEIEASAVIAPL